MIRIELLLCGVSDEELEVFYFTSSRKGAEMNKIIVLSGGKTAKDGICCFTSYLKFRGK
jgi:hypothetical protein